MLISVTFKFESLILDRETVESEWTFNFMIYLLS